MFRGISNLSLDAKGRFAMPTRYREALSSASAGSLVLTLGADDPCLVIYPAPVYEEIERQLAAIPGTNRRAARVRRLVVGHASWQEMDASGRLLVPPELRDVAKLDKGIALVGLGNKFELWDEATWRATMYDAAAGDADEEGSDALEQIAL